MADYTQKAERDALRKPVDKIRESLLFVGPQNAAEWIVGLVDACDTLEARNAALEKALRLTKAALSAHGPCRNNSCSECGRAFDATCAALEGKQP